MIKVKATREGLVGKKTATGWIIDDEFPFVALPAHDALNHWVKVFNPLNGRMVCAQVRDVGPFNEHDNNYVFQLVTNGTDGPQAFEVRPQAESGISVSGHGTNKAGIDLGGYVWNALGMKDNTEVMWEFVKVKVTSVPGPVS